MRLLRFRCFRRFGGGGFAGHQHGLGRRCAHDERFLLGAVVGLRLGGSLSCGRLIGQRGPRVECGQAAIDQVQHVLGAGTVFFDCPFQVVVDAADGIGQLVQGFPIGMLLRQHIGDVVSAIRQLPGRPGQGDHVQGATGFVDNARSVFQVAVVPARGHVGNDRALDRVQRFPGFPGNSALGFAGNSLDFALATQPLGRAGQILVDLDERFGHIGQRRHLELLAEQAIVDRLDLIEDR